MNILSKLQVLLLAFLLSVLGVFIMEPLLLIPAALFVVLQIMLTRGELKRAYPEDWLKYAMVFIVYEVILVVFLAIVRSVSFSATGLAGIYNILIFIFAILVMTIALRFFLGRKYSYGEVLFSTPEWVGVSIKSDLFTRINDANYAVRNSGLKLKAGDRVKVRLEGSFGKAKPSRVVEKEK